MGPPCKDEYHKLCTLDEPKGKVLESLGGGRWIQCGGCGWWILSPFQPDERNFLGSGCVVEPTVTAAVEHDIAHGAAPALRTNQTIRELMEKEKNPNG